MLSKLSKLYFQFEWEGNLDMWDSQVSEVVEAWEKSQLFFDITFILYHENRSLFAVPNTGLLSCHFLWNTWLRMRSQESRITMIRANGMCLLSISITESIVWVMIRRGALSIQLLITLSNALCPELWLDFALAKGPVIRSRSNSVPTFSWSLAQLREIFLKCLCTRVSRTTACILHAQTFPLPSIFFQRCD